MKHAPPWPPSMQVFQRGWLSSNNILFTAAETVLVDSGYVTHAPQTLALVADALQGRALDCIVNTHLHSDHCGGNAALQQTYACRTRIPAAEADKVRHWDEQALSFKATGQQCARFSVDEELHSGDCLELGAMQWQAWAAPGHDPHSVILYCEEEQILISADALWENGFGVIFPELNGESGFAEARATLELIASLKVRLVIPGHGAPFTNVDLALQTAFSRLDYLAADPERNARHAINVLLKFLLLERQSIPVASLPGLLGSIAFCRQANARYLHMTETALARSSVAQLVRAGAAVLVGESLCNVDK